MRPTTKKQLQTAVIDMKICGIGENRKGSAWNWWRDCHKLKG